MKLRSGTRRHGEGCRGRRGVQGQERGAGAGEAAGRRYTRGGYQNIRKCLNNKKLQQMEDVEEEEEAWGVQMTQVREVRGV